MNAADGAIPISDRWTVLRLLKTTTDYLLKKGYESARLDAELLLGEVLGLDRVKLYCSFDRPVAQLEIDSFRELVRRRAAGEPVAYIRGIKEFYGLTFKVGPGVLIPRPDTEHLVDETLRHLAEEAEARVLEVGAGSGAVAVAIAKARAGVAVDATEISEEAFAWATKNVEAHGVSDRVRIVRGDLFADLSGPYDIVCSNPPYIDPARGETLMRDVIKFEPHAALFAEDGGTAMFRRIIAGAPAIIVNGGRLLLELGFDQGDAVREILCADGRYEEPVFVMDFSGKRRVLSARLSE